MLRFAIIGCGLIGKKRLAALPRGSVVAACDLDPRRAGELAGAASATCIACTNVQSALEAGPDAVIVATVNGSLAEITAECICAGKHVLVEKPVATSLSEIDLLLELARRHEVVVRAGYNHRFHPSLQRAHEIVASGALGEVMFIRGRYGHGGRPGYDREWRADPRLSGGGELMDQGVHLVDLASWFMAADWTSIEGHTATYYWDMPVDDNAFLSLRTASGQTAWLQVSCTEWKNMFSLELYGRSGKLQIEGLGGSYGVERLYHYQMRPEMGPPDTVIAEYPRQDNSWAIETAAFIEDIEHGRRPAPGLAEARATLKVVETIYQNSGFPVGGGIAAR